VGPSQIAWSKNGGCGKSDEVGNAWGGGKKLGGGVCRSKKRSGHEDLARNFLIKIRAWPIQSGAIQTLGGKKQSLGGQLKLVEGGKTERRNEEKVLSHLITRKAGGANS